MKNNEILNAKCQDSKLENLELSEMVDVVGGQKPYYGYSLLYDPYTGTSVFVDSGGFHAFKYTNTSMNSTRVYMPPSFYSK